MLNLRTKNINNAAAVLGGYDAMVRAGLPTETGSPKFSAPSSANKAQPAPKAAEPKQPVAAAQGNQAANTQSAAKSKTTKQRKARTKH